MAYSTVTMKVVESTNCHGCLPRLRSCDIANNMLCVEDVTVNNSVMSAIDNIYLLVDGFFCGSRM